MPFGSTTPAAGLAIQGGNAQIIDADASEINEVITATVTAGPGQFALQGVGFVGRAGGAGMDVDNTIYALSTSSGTVDVSAQGVTGTFTLASSASAVGQGFVLSGLAFDFPTPLTASDVVVSFANSGTGFGDPTDSRTIPWVPSGTASASITLDFAIDGAGVVSLDASTNGTDTLFQNMVAEWDNARAGSVADPPCWGRVSPWSEARVAERVGFRSPRAAAGASASRARTRTGSMA